MGLRLGPFWARWATFTLGISFTSCLICALAAKTSAEGALGAVVEILSEHWWVVLSVGLIFALVTEAGSWLQVRFSKRHFAVLNAVAWVGWIAWNVYRSFPAHR